MLTALVLFFLLLKTTCADSPRSSAPFLVVQLQNRTSCTPSVTACVGWLQDGEIDTHCTGREGGEGSPHPQAYGDTANDGCKQPTLSGILRDNYILQPDVQILVQNKMEKNYFLSADVQIHVQTRRKCQEPAAAMHLALNHFQEWNVSKFGIMFWFSRNYHYQCHLSGYKTL